MKLLSKNILAAVLGAIALTAAAQNAPKGERPAGAGPGPHGPGGPRRGPSPLIVALDTNNDGVIDATEIANAAAALLTLDKNGDGQLSKDELRPARPDDRGANGAPPEPPADAPPGAKGPGPHRGGSPIIAALDKNHDGVLDATEIANAPAALLTLDKNGDGQLSHDEIAPGRPSGGHGPGGPGGHRPGGKPAPAASGA